LKKEVYPITNSGELVPESLSSEFLKKKKLALTVLWHRLSDFPKHPKSEHQGLPISLLNLWLPLGVSIAGNSSQHPEQSTTTFPLRNLAAEIGEMIFLGQTIHRHHHPLNVGKKSQRQRWKGGEEGNLALDYDLGIGDDFVMPPSPTRHSVDEEEDGGGGVTYPTSVHERYIELYPGDAGKGLRQSKTQFEVWLENQKKRRKKIDGTRSQAKRNGP
jgi:hypothetical protein